MALRASSLQSTNTLAINREIGSQYDVILAVKEHLDAIGLVAAIDVDALLTELQNAQDFSGITVVPGKVASFDPITKVLTIPTVKGDTGAQGPQGIHGIQGPAGPRGPRGLTGTPGTNGTDGLNGANGVTGLNGMVPVIEFSIDNDGNLVYEVVGYEEGPAMKSRYTTQEW